MYSRSTVNEISDERDRRTIHTAVNVRGGRDVYRPSRATFPPRPVLFVRRLEIGARARTVTSRSSVTGGGGNRVGIPTRTFRRRYRSVLVVGRVARVGSDGPAVTERSRWRSRPPFPSTALHPSKRFVVVDRVPGGNHFTSVRTYSFEIQFFPSSRLPAFSSSVRCSPARQLTPTTCPTDKRRSFYLFFPARPACRPVLNTHAHEQKRICRPSSTSKSTSLEYRLRRVIWPRTWVFVRANFRISRSSSQQLPGPII